jgi:hypothetical protein
MSYLLLGLIVVGVLVGVFLWKLGKKYAPLAGEIDKREAELDAEAKTRAKARELKSAFLDVRAVPLASEASRALRQVEAVFEIHAQYTRSLAGKFPPGEMTYSRYEAMGEQVFLGMLGNLRQLAALLKNLEAMESATPGAALGEAARPQREKLQALLDEVDQGLAAFGSAEASLAEIKTGRDGAKLGLDQSMQQLKELADRAHRYSND